MEPSPKRPEARQPAARAKHGVIVYKVHRTGLYACLLVTLVYGLACPAAESPPRRPRIPGRIELHTEGLPMRYLQLRLPELALLDYTGKGDPNTGTWLLTARPDPNEPTFWLFRLEQTTDKVHRRMDYVVRELTPNSASEPGHWEPVLTSAWTLALKQETVLDCNQTADWIIRDLEHSRDYTVELSQTAHWVRTHLDQVYSRAILTRCADYFWHHADADGPFSGYSHVIACTDRQIELDPQDIEAYTNNAWLLWSDWVSWTHDPNKMPNGREGVDRALRTLEKGHAANPLNALFHVDAAQTLYPLALHHRPDLMAVVTRYYTQAHDLISDRDLLIRIRKGLGHVYRNQGQTAQALHWYRSVLELDPGNPVALRYIQKLESGQ